MEKNPSNLQRRPFRTEPSSKPDVHREVCWWRGSGGARKLRLRLKHFLGVVQLSNAGAGQQQI